jgi:glycosyltransferase involved in cell wall biosynthesis
MKRTIALVMIVKNEEKGLEKAILSCKDFVDEIVIAVDITSEDKTLEIARKYATTLKQFSWQDDFSKARNFAQEGVKTDWLFFLDGHEYVEKSLDLEKYLNFDCDSLLCTIRMENGFVFRNPRIYKNGLTFSGAVHEKQNCERAIFYPSFIIVHDRVNLQDEDSAKIRERQRNEQMPRIMGERIKKDKRDLRALFHLSVFYQTNNQNKKALHYSKRYLKYSTLKEERWYMYFNRALIFSLLGKNFRAFWAINQAEGEIAERWETQKLKGLIFFNAKKYEKALDCLVDSFKKNKMPHSYQPWPIDSAGTWNVIGECFFNLGILDKASIAFRTASEQSKEEFQKQFFKARADLLEKMLKK